MLKEKNYIFSRLNMLMDATLAALAFAAAHFLRNLVLSPWLFPNLLAPSRFRHYAWLLPVFPVVTVAVLALNRAYDSQRVRDTSRIVRGLFVSSLEVMVVCLSIIYMIYKKDVVSRGQMVVAPALLFLLLSLKTVIVKRSLTGLRRRGFNYRDLLFVGSGPRLEEFLALLESHPFWGFRVAGILTDDPGFAGSDRIAPGLILGRAEDALEFIEKNPVDEVIFFPARMDQANLGRLLEGLELMGVTARLAVNFFSPRVAGVSLDCYEKVPLITFNPVRDMNAALFVKYGLDRLAALVLLLLLSPLLLAVMLIIRLTSRKGDPIFYTQTRSGLNGKPFTMVKFRSMKVGADAELEKLRARSDVDGPVFKMKRDPRVTSFGRFIRKFSIDELPQLWNVLRGDMSLVGPRPPLPAEVEKYDRWQRRRLSMKPGITCLWQVMGRNRLDFDTWMKLDLAYIDNWSLWLDFTILVRTVFVVLTGYGAS